MTPAINDTTTQLTATKTVNDRNQQISNDANENDKKREREKSKNIDNPNQEDDNTPKKTEQPNTEMKDLENMDDMPEINEAF